jgi:hypothetical protein
MKQYYFILEKHLENQGYDVAYQLNLKNALGRNID